MTRGVLVAESDATELELIATVLARDGFHVVRATDGETAIMSFEGCELVVCASELTGIDGAAVCATIKRAKPQTRFVLLHPSGNDVDVCSVLLSRIGCDAILPSPFRYDALKSVLSEWGMRAPARVAAVPMSFAVPAPDISALVAAPSALELLPSEPIVELVVSSSADAPIAVPIPIPVVFPVATETPPLAEYVGAVPVASPVAAELAPSSVIAESTPLPEDVRTAAYAYAMMGGAPTLALDEITMDLPPPPPDELAVAQINLADEPALQGDWLLAPPDEHSDGFAGLDFGSGLDSVLDAALGDIPMARAESSAIEFDTTAIPPPAPELVADPSAIDIELAPPPALSVTFTHQPETAPEDVAAIDIGIVPPPAPREADSSVESGATVWAPSSTGAPLVDVLRVEAPRIEARGIVTPPPSPPADDRPPPAPVDAAPAPPPPPHEALKEPPALPFEAITQRTATTSEPRTTLPPGVPPDGDLQTTPLPRLLFELYGGTYCGTLRLSRKGAERTIDVWNGFPVAVTITPLPGDDDLASLLREHGRITPDQHVDARKRAPGREAQLLVALGIIDERDLLDVIREQTELRLAASFSWRDGTYRITPSKEPPDSVVLSEVHPVKIIWRGVCEHYDAGSLLAFFSTLRARYIVATEVFPIHYQTLGPFLRRVGVAHLLDGQTTFEQALRSDDSQALAIAQTLYVLIVTEMIRAQSTPGVKAVFPNTVKATSAVKPVDYRDLAKACEDVAKSYLALKGCDFFAMLELPRTANEAEVASSYERVAKRFKPENLLPGLPDDVVRRAREIDGLLRRARDTLLSPEERRRYSLRLADTEPPPSQAGGGLAVS